MPGGPRQGQPGRSYAQRSDLNANRQPVRTAPSQQYGMAAQQQAAQQAVPLEQKPQGLAGLLAGFAPSSAPGGFGAPSERPDEPVTAGLPFGPGAGVEGMPQFAQPDDDTLIMLKAMYAKFPTEEIAELIEMME